MREGQQQQHSVSPSWSTLLDYSTTSSRYEKTVKDAESPCAWQDSATDFVSYMLGDERLSAAEERQQKQHEDELDTSDDDTFRQDEFSSERDACAGGGVTSSKRISLPQQQFTSDRDFGGFSSDATTTIASSVPSFRQDNDGEDIEFELIMPPTESNLRDDTAVVVSAARSDDGFDSGDSGSPMTTATANTSDDGNGLDFDSVSKIEDQHSNSTAAPRRNFSDVWTGFIKESHRPILNVLQKIARTSALNPKSTIFSVVFMSFLLLGVGFLTNFNVDVDEDALWTPARSKAIQHAQWITEDSGFPKTSRFLLLYFHASGGNILGKEQFARTIEVLDTLRGFPGYDEICEESTYVSPYGQRTCEIIGLTRFWNNSATTFAESVVDDADLRKQASAASFPDGFPAPHESLMSYLRRDENNTLVSAKSMFVVVWTPDNVDTQKWELEAIDEVLKLNDKWGPLDDGTIFRIEPLAEGSLPAEFMRAITNDIPLVPLVFVMMSAFVSIVFARCHRVHSRSLLGSGAVFAVLLSIVSGFGLLFCIGVPFTPITQMLPFVIFGIGLDDAFIVIGSYQRTDPLKDPVARIADTVDDIGLSISLTTITSATAFGLGCLSSVPAVFWLCQYCFPTILIVFLYQMTFFVACIVLDEKRIVDQRMDCCIWASVGPSEDHVEANDYVTESSKEPVVDRMMGWYAELLLRPWVKIVVAVAFLALFIASGFSASKFEQEFKLTDILPRDSYAADYIFATNEYTETGAFDITVYFRNVDQSDVEVQQQMVNYTAALLEGSDNIIELPEFFWLEHFNLYRTFTLRGQNLTFPEQIQAFLNVPLFHELYHRDIALDGDGNIVASRTRMRSTVDLLSVEDQIYAMRAQRSVSEFFVGNEGHQDDFNFFTYDAVYNVWEFYLKSVDELISTTIIGVVSVTFVALVFIPHWSAFLFVLPLICILYVDLLGVMQWGGLHINALSYVSLTMSIGLLVDFVMHILFRYYECDGNRREKTVKMLKTMGASILLGGTTTFLGTLPLMFSSSDVFRITFITFLGIVTLGVGHGLILLPVLLSTFGPEATVSMAMERKNARGSKKLKKGPKTLDEDWDEVEL